MRRTSAPTAFAWLFAPILAALAPSAPAHGDDVPKAETVLEDYVKATGGKAAYEKLKNRTVTASIEITGANIKGTIKFTQAAPNSMVVATEIGQLQITQGTDGKTVWAVSSILGDRLLEGAEKDQFLDEAMFNDEIRWKERFTKVECAGVEDVNGKPAYKLVLTPRAGKPITKYYDKESHLIVKEVETTAGPMGEMTAETYPSDYRKTDGILIPFKLAQSQGGQSFEIKVTEVKHNVDLPADTFKVPAALEKK
ncbi:MAG: LolA-like protein [Isosphaeraceae bacterium]